VTGEIGTFEEKGKKKLLENFMSGESGTVKGVADETFLNHGYQESRKRVAEGLVVQRGKGGGTRTV